MKTLHAPPATKARVRLSLRVAVIDPIAGWTPRSWDDAPDDGEILSMTTARSRAYAEGLIYAFNAKRLTQTGTNRDRRWAILLRRSVRLRPGDRCYRRLPSFDGG